MRCIGCGEEFSPRSGDRGLQYCLICMDLREDPRHGLTAQEWAELFGPRCSECGEAGAALRKGVCVFCLHAR
jgi:hypothetical protein